jgi:hypothetical protein
MEETISFGPIEMAQEINTRLVTSAAVKKDQTKTNILIVISLIITVGIIYMIATPSKDTQAVKTSEPGEN